MVSLAAPEGGEHERLGPIRRRGRITDAHDLASSRVQDQPRRKQPPQQQVVHSQLHIKFISLLNVAIRNLLTTCVAEDSILAMTRNSCYTVHVMRERHLRNITITLDEDVAHWARVQAAHQDVSVSRLIAGLLEERMQQADGYRTAMRRALARKPFLHTDGRYPSREEAHARGDLR